MSKNFHKSSKINQIDASIKKLEKRLRQIRRKGYKYYSNQEDIIDLLRDKVEFIVNDIKSNKRKASRLRLISVIIALLGVFVTISTNYNRISIAKKSGAFNTGSIALQLGDFGLSSSKMNNFVILRKMEKWETTQTLKMFIENKYLYVLPFKIVNEGEKTVERGNVHFQYYNLFTKLSMDIDTSFITIKTIEPKSYQREYEEVGDFEIISRPFNKIHPAQKYKLNEIVCFKPFELLEKSYYMRKAIRNEEYDLDISEDTLLNGFSRMDDYTENFTFPFKITVSGKDIPSQDFNCSLTFANHDNPASNMLDSLDINFKGMNNFFLHREDLHLISMTIENGTYKRHFSQSFTEEDIQQKFKRKKTKEINQERDLGVEVEKAIEVLTYLDINRGKKGEKLHKEELHYILVTLNTPKIDLSEVRLSISNHHKKYYDSRNLLTASLKLDDSTQIMTIRRFKNVWNAEDYAKSARGNIEYLGNLDKEYKVYPISRHNYKALLRSKKLEEYIDFYNENYK